MLMRWRQQAYVTNYSVLLWVGRSEMRFDGRKDLGIMRDRTGLAVLIWKF